KSDNREIDRSQARLLLPRLRVLAFGQSSVDGGAARSANGNGSSTRSESNSQRAEAARTAVLAVPVDEVNRLTLGDANARLVLALRRPDDMELPNPELFAELPPAVQPLPRRAGEAARAPLEG